MSTSLYISTGNILNINKKTGQKPSEELFDTLKTCIDSDGNAFRTKCYNDLLDKISENERDNIKIGTKVFLNTYSEDNLRQAITSLLSELKVDFLDTLILAYHPYKSDGDATFQTNGQHSNGADTDGDEPKEEIFEWGAGTPSAMNELIKLWRILEEFAEKEKILHLGAADLDTVSLSKLYDSAKIKPIISQINLSACCVVPPSLQEFTNKHDIQLLTHSDPEEIMSKSTLQKLVPNKNLQPSWTARYQVHIKCRGVLAAKGFIFYGHNV